MQKHNIVPGIIYKFRRGQVTAYSSNPKKYNCAVPVDYWQSSTLIGDVWVTDKNGNVDPGLSSSPVPVYRDTLGAMVGRW